MSYVEKNYLIFLPNDYSFTFCVPEKKDGNVCSETYYFNWMLKRGTFYRFVNVTDFELSLGFLSSLNQAAFGFPVPDYFDLTFLKAYRFDTFTPLILSTWFSKKLSSSFDNKDIFSVDDFSPCKFLLGSGSLTTRAVRKFYSFEDFDKIMKDFLFRFKNINSVSFFEIDDDYDFINNEEHLC